MDWGYRPILLIWSHMINIMVTNTIPAVIKIIVRQGGVFVFKGTEL